jgi:hypothetical protein
MKQQHKYPEVTQFSDLAGRLAKADQMIRVNNASADILYEQTGQVMPRYDAEQAKRSITKEYNKFYGYDNKYHAI